MTISVLLVTHAEVGEALLKAVTRTMDELPLPTTVVTVNYDSDLTDLVPRVKKVAAEFAKHEGLLILTDLFGSTPSNIAQELQKLGNVRVVSGLNFPMLIRVMNYPGLTLDKLAEKAVSGGKDGVIDCKRQNDD